MKTHVFRLRRGDDLMKSIEAYCREHAINAGVILSGVGCVSEAKVRDASGVSIQSISEHMEIVSLTGTVSASRCHLHIAFSKENLSTIGGHLVEGCTINTTCELAILELDDMTFGKVFDPLTGYYELNIETK